MRLMRAERPDVVYVNTVTLPLWLVLARLTGRPSIAHVHEAEHSAHPVVRRALATPLLLARAIVANSDYCVEVISGVYPALRDRSVVILAGSGVPGNDGVVRALHELADEPSLRNAVHFLGYRDVVWEVLADCDVLVVPSRMEEGFGNTAVEGALAARPVVVSDTSGLREASAGFASMQRVQPGDAAALRDALGTVIEDWARFRALAADDRSVALRRHDPARYRTSIATAAATVRGPLMLSAGLRRSSSRDSADGPLLAAASDTDGGP
jgi:hypothetical protein